MHHLFVCTMKISETPHTGHPHSTHMHTLVYGVTCLGAFVSGCAFILDYQKKEWQVLLRHASGFGGGRWCWWTRVCMRAAVNFLLLPYAGRGIPVLALPYQFDPSQSLNLSKLRVHAPPFHSTLLSSSSWSIADGMEAMHQ